MADSEVQWKSHRLRLVDNGDGTYSFGTSGSGGGGGGGDASAANQVTQTGILTTIDADTGAMLTALQLIDNAVAGNELQVDVVAALPAGTNNIGDVDVLTLPALPAGTNAIGKLAANSGVDIGDVDVVTTALPTLAATSSVTSVNDAATSATLLSSNASRKSFRMYNDSAQSCYVKYGTTATSSDFTVLLLPGSYLEEYFYSGRVDGIWAADGSGAMRITELS